MSEDYQKEAARFLQKELHRERPGITQREAARFRRKLPRLIMTACCLGLISSFVSAALPLPVSPALVILACFAVFTAVFVFYRTRPSLPPFFDYDLGEFVALLIIGGLSVLPIRYLFVKIAFFVIS